MGRLRGCLIADRVKWFCLFESIRYLHDVRPFVDLLVANMEFHIGDSDAVYNAVDDFHHFTPADGARPPVSRHNTSRVGYMSITCVVRRRAWGKASRRRHVCRGYDFWRVVGRRRILNTLVPCGVEGFVLPAHQSDAPKEHA